MVMSEDEAGKITEELRKVNKRLDDLLLGTTENQGTGLYKQFDDIKASHRSLETAFLEHKTIAEKRLTEVRKEVLSLLLWRKFVLGCTAVGLMIWGLVVKAWKLV